MQVDYKKLRIGVGEYMDTQNRFTKLKRENKEKSERYYKSAQEKTDERHEK